MFWRKRAGRAIPKQGVRNLFHGVEITTPQDCCPAAAAIRGQRFLSEEAPLLPLEDCDRRMSCRCRYRHFVDRRTEARRDSDLGLPSRPYPQDKRTGRGRRITDV
jgi:hypothetical protein